MNMKKMTAVCVLLASGGLPHALAARPKREQPNGSVDFA